MRGDAHIAGDDIAETPIIRACIYSCTMIASPANLLLSWSNSRDSELAEDEFRWWLYGFLFLFSYG